MRIDRRTLLSTSFLALVARVPALILPPSAALSTSVTAAPASGFYGNPNTIISAIDIGGGIACSRTSGDTPCFVQVSASRIACSGYRILASGGVAANAYEDLEYTWDFGDPHGTEIFERPTDGVSVNANTQLGPEAAYCYRHPGYYTVTLTIRAKSSDGYLTSKLKQMMTVSRFVATVGSEYWIDSVHGSDSYSGTSASNPKKNLSFLQTGVGGTIPNWPGTKTTSGNIAIHLAQGSHWVVPSGLLVPNVNAYGGPASNLRIDSFVGVGGAGPQPIIEVNGKTPAFDAGNPGPSRAKGNFVVSDVKFTNSAAASGSSLIFILLGSLGHGPLTMTDIYFDNCVIVNEANLPSFMNFVVTGGGDAGSLFSNMGIWGGSVTGAIFDTLPKTKHAIFGGPRIWWFVFGSNIAGSGSNPILDHHIYPETQYHSLYKWITFGPTGTTNNSQRNYCINTNVDQAGPGLTTASYFLISENSLSGTKLIHDIDDVNNDPTKVQFVNFVTERNAIFNIRDVSPTPQAGGILFGCGKSVTVRDNRVWNSNGFFTPFACSASVLSASIYRNSIYIPPSSVSVAQIQLGGLISMTAPAVSKGAEIVLLNAGGNTLPVGTKVTLSGDLPSPLTAGTPYYISARPTPGSTCTLSAAIDGENIVWDGIKSGGGAIRLQTHLTRPQWITDNIVLDERSVGCVIDVVSSDQVAALSLVDRNQYWKIGETLNTKFFVDNGAAKSFAEWQLTVPGKYFDEAGSVSKPSWNIPPSRWSDFGA